MLQKLFSDMVTDVGRNIQDTSSNTKTVIKNYINEAYFDLLKESNYNNINDGYTFNTVAGTKDYQLPDNFKKPLYVLDTTNKVYLKEIDIQKFAQDTPSQVDTQGSVSAYALLTRAYITKPSSTLSLVSDNALDTTQTVRIRGFNGNTEITEDVTLDGINAQVTSNTFTDISSISKSAATSGIVTITSGSDTVAVIGNAILNYRAVIMRIITTPSSAIAISAPYVIDPKPLSDDNDVMVVSGEDYVVNRATAKAWRRKRQFAKAKDFDIEAERALVRIMWDMENCPNNLHELQINPYSRETV